MGILIIASLIFGYCCEGVAGVFVVLIGFWGLIGVECILRQKQLDKLHEEEEEIRAGRKPMTLDFLYKQCGKKKWF